ncbi:unnamed protein product [Medioppia subpectinata]|uniref:Nuclear receptor domain-containing protein n=1 Tax=Medioppia subpectinata TaxID=1979941 RepID=A0A7R9KAM1_9ACAR|nr:unnamed protein product [Medioppia subpectinata]CAG2099951.1 unnamed protein product [Medioppia subpectinata]
MLSYNFNVLTCSSCKAFFRRNALKDGNALKCPFSGNCDLTYLTRKFCQKCRLNKCFALGMKKDLILPERELQLRKERRIRKKLDLKLNKNNDQKSCNSSSDETQDISGSDCDILDQFLFNNTISDEDIEAQVMDIETCLTSTAAKVCESVTPIVSINRPITDYNNNFNAIEGNRLTELLSASNSLKISYGSVVSVADTYIDAMSALCCNVEEMVIKSIEMSKNISLFSELCVNDQISLMKYGSIQVTYLRNITGFDPNTNQLTVPDEDPSQSVLVDLNAIKCTKLYVFEACMTAIILFDPSRPNLQHRKLVKTCTKN